MLNEHDLSLSGRDSVGRNKEFDIPFNSHYVAGLSHQRDGGVSRPVLSSTVENVHSVPHSERDESRAIVGQVLELLSPISRGFWMSGSLRQSKSVAEKLT